MEIKRATSFKELQQKSAALFGHVAKGEREPYRPEPTDIIISPYGKCGTTWLQQMFHTLRTRGDIDFDDISRVVPWIETAPLLGIDLNAPQRGEPRGFKSHMAWDKLPRGAKYLVSMRDPRDALVSQYRFMEGWFLEPGAIPLDDFARKRSIDIPDESSIWYHIGSFWEHRDDDNVLLLSYESMKDDHEGTVRRIAAFCDIALDDELLAITLSNSSLPFMLAHKDRFDDRMLRDASEALAGLPPGSDSAKVREGKVGGYANVLSPQILTELDRKWAEMIESRFGFSNYATMEAALRQSL